MIKSKFGPITNLKTGETKDIVVNILSKKNVRDIFIGFGIISAGITYIAFSLFKNGAYAFEEAEFETLQNLGLMK